MLSFVSHYIRVCFQLLLFMLTKAFVLRGRRAAPTIAFEAGPHLIAANHRNALDPFVLVSCLRFRDFFRLAPFSFMTANVFMRPLWVRPIAWAAGCFPAKPGLGAYGIDKAVDNLRHGYSVVIFPEGTRVRPGTTKEAKRGVSTILETLPSTPLVLVRLEWQRPYTIDFVGISYPKQSMAQSSADAILEAIYRL